jgi:hypothetical protein
MRARKRWVLWDVRDWRRSPGYDTRFRRVGQKGGQLGPVELSNEVGEWFGVRWIDPSNLVWVWNRRNQKRRERRGKGMTS